MSSAFTLRLPADPRFRAMAHDVVGRYLELCGASPSERDAFVRLFGEAAAAIAGADSEPLDVVCTTHPAEFTIVLRSGGRERLLRHPLPAEKR